MKKEYFIKPPYNEKGCFVVIGKEPFIWKTGKFAGKPMCVNLNGESGETTSPATRSRPAITIPYHGATSEELGILLNNPDKYGLWGYMIGEREVEEKKPKRVKKKEEQ